MASLSEEWSARSESLTSRSYSCRSGGSTSSYMSRGSMSMSRGSMSMSWSRGSSGVSSSSRSWGATSRSSSPRGWEGSYKCTGKVRAEGAIHALLLRGENVYCGAENGAIRVFRAADMAEVEGLKGGEGAVKAMVAYKGHVISGHQDSKIRLWRSGRGKRHKLLATLPTFKNFFVACLLAKNYVQVRRHESSLWISHNDAISALALCPRGSTLYSASWDRSIKIWRLSDLKCLHSFRAHDDAINSIAVCPAGFLYTASADSTIKIWSKDGQKQEHFLVQTLSHHKSGVNSLALSSLGKSCTLYSASCDSTVMVWERIDPFKPVVLKETLFGHHRAVLCLAIAGKEGVLCSGSADKTIRIWKRDFSTCSHYCVAVLEGHRAPVKSVAISADNWSGFSVFSSDLRRYIRSWWVSGEMDESCGEESGSDATSMEISSSKSSSMRSEL